MNIAATSLRRKAVVAALLALLVAGVSLVLLLGSSQPAVADQNPNNTDCRGHIEKGTADPDDPSSTQVKYVFACSGPITGYQIQPDHQVQGMETEVFAKDRTTGDVVASDLFSCQGDIPGLGVNCTGTYGGDYRIVEGQFSISEKLCAEPRVDPLLTVTYAVVVSGKLTQYIAGPFDLGRPWACPKSTRAGKLRIPRVSLESAE